jgi:glyoxylase-like metal-dependent hydrolase (beta-lactamase superfamily II)
MELREIANDVYACLQEDRGLGYSNSGLINQGGGLVVDTFWDLPHTREMLEQYGRVWSGPAQRVVNTHHNGDHCWGNQLFDDAEIIAHRACAERFATENPAAMLALSRQTDNDNLAIAALARRFADWDFEGIELKPPTTLVEDRMQVQLGDVRAELIHVGPAHTEGDLIVHLPEHKVVFTGDVLFRLCTPIGWEGTYQRWIEALDFIVALEPEVVVPGHGPLCGTEGPTEMKEYLMFVRGEAQRYFEQGLPALEAAKKIDLGPYAGWTEPGRLIFQVERAYREFRGEAFDAEVNVNAAFTDMYTLEQSWNA